MEQIQQIWNDFVLWITSVFDDFVKPYWYWYDSPAAGRGNFFRPMDDVCSPGDFDYVCGAVFRGDSAVLPQGSSTQWFPGIPGTAEKGAGSLDGRAD